MTEKPEVEITEETSEIIVSVKQERELRKLASKSSQKKRIIDIGCQIEPAKDLMVYNNSIGLIDEEDDILEVFEDE